MIEAIIEFFAVCVLAVGAATVLLIIVAFYDEYGPCIHTWSKWGQRKENTQMRRCSKCKFIEEVEVFKHDHIPKS